MKVVDSGSTSEWLRGPFKAWPIYLGEPLDTVAWERGPMDEAPAGEFVRGTGTAFLDPSNELLLIRPASDATEADIHAMTRELREYRDNKRLIGFATPALVVGLTGLIHITELGERMTVVRCEEIGCDKFGGWHKVNSRRPFEAAELHQTCDLGTAAFRCRLLWKSTRWMLDVGTKAAWTDDPERWSRLLGEAILEATSRAVDLNGWLLSGSETAMGRA